MNLLEMGNESRCLSFLIWQFPTQLLLKLGISEIY